MASHKGTSQYNSPSTWAELKKTIPLEIPLQTSQTEEELKDVQIKKHRAEINLSIDKMLSCPIPMENLRADVEKCKGGNITNCFEKWENITQDQFLLNIVKFGLTMALVEIPMCQFVPPLNFSSVETEIIDEEIWKIFSKSVIVSTTRKANDYVCRIFKRTRKDRNYRMILYLRTVNEFLKFKHCKLDSIEDALDLITEGCYFGLVDLKDAYCSIPIHENYQKHLKLFSKEEYYQYIVLPSGFKSPMNPTPRVFTIDLTPPFKYVRSKRHLSVKCVDDSLLLGKTFEICSKNIRATVALLWELGFTIHPEKSVLIPTQ